MSARNRGKKTNKPLTRVQGTRQANATFRIYAEGEVTEVDYVHALLNHPDIANGSAVEIVIEESGATPYTLVQRARDDKKRGIGDIDHFWCVFDVESPPEKRDKHLSAAIDTARANDIGLAVSNPCFELWLILHFESATAHLTTNEAIRRRRELDASTGKEVDEDRYMDQLTQAMRRAEKLDSKHKDDDTQFPENNPSSTMYKLVHQLMKEASDSKLSV
ncbi:RloB family protein [Micrococcus antarcticus]|uniref:RloB family protein n=1 Tax=Glutamicibacter sp. 2E12 TaxID=3416181 RepID=UPI0036346666